MSDPTMQARPIVEPDTLTEPWWDATRNEQLLVQRCDACGHHQHYPRPLCTNCASTRLEYVRSSGRGEIYSFTVIHRSLGPPFDPPYVVALVRLDEGPVLLTNIVGISPDELRCDMPVEVAWEALPDGRKLPLFTPARR